MDKKDILVRRNCFEFSAIIILESGISITKVRQPNTYEKGSSSNWVASFLLLMESNSVFGSVSPRYAQKTCAEMRNSVKVKAEDMQLYAVTDTQWLNGRDFLEVIESVLANGATFLQLREKNARSEERRVGKECRSRWSPYH